MLCDPILHSSGSQRQHSRKYVMKAEGWDSFHLPRAQARLPKVSEDAAGVCGETGLPPRAPDRDRRYYTPVGPSKTSRGLLSH
ncbi:hypothetical protein NDU88_001255 [Pleurodeles waltl]|uniref:Uncharacterized protein n=1 Tax=Pleurodeles waltl TaxID=8319 RepID=A0AAV7M0L2_PLEWA|nr:hypothetical protein NDU88_001255 [Pleurodeles waltl]